MCWIFMLFFSMRKERKVKNFASVAFIYCGGVPRTLCSKPSDLSSLSCLMEELGEKLGNHSLTANLCKNTVKVSFSLPSCEYKQHLIDLMLLLSQREDFLTLLKFNNESAMYTCLFLIGNHFIGTKIFNQNRLCSFCRGLICWSLGREW